MLRNSIVLGLIASVLSVIIAACSSSSVNKKPPLTVIFQTTVGDIEIKLFPGDAPVSVNNFLSYVRSGFYNGTVFHRVIDGFMIQGGGFDANLNRKPVNSPIQNEADNGLKNYRGTVAYARTGEVNSATSQFFINLVDNHPLDYKNSSASGYGYCVFGEVVKGMGVVDKIAKAKTGIRNGMQDVPLAPIVILSSRVIGDESSSGKGE
ncbi:peptidyl-prolyl cis-trans isomerase [bacterium]|nr:peptidyl-prolyl cis-trans isomerase [bacterium]